MKIIPIIQARSNSKRLPQKVLKKFSSGLTTIDYILNGLRAQHFNTIYLATTTTPEDDILYETYRNQVHVFRGDEEDVLSRFLSVIERENPDWVVRICADNPFLFTAGIRFLTEQISKYPNCEYFSFHVQNKPAMKIGTGIFAELISAKALREVAISPSKLDREHVTINLYHDQSKNSFHLFDFEEIYFPINSELRLTLDTQEDFEIIDKVIRDLNLPPVIDQKSLEEVIKFVEGQDMIQVMKNESHKTINSKEYKETK